MTGARAPFNDRAADMARYYHGMGLYMPCTIGSARVLLFKSGLHPAYDGPATPLRKLMIEITQTVQPKVMITTGTGGAIGADVLLGDVVVAAQTRFDCTKQFKKQRWAQASYPTSTLLAGTLAAITPDLTRVSASRIPSARAEPKIWTGGQQATVVTTDFFAFDDSTDFYKLQGLGRACDMGDAMVGHAMQDCPGVNWYAVRNTSDPQIANPDGDVKAANHKAGQIYAEWGAFTTAASAIATWAHHRRAIQPSLRAGCDSGPGRRRPGPYRTAGNYRRMNCGAGSAHALALAPR